MKKTSALTLLESNGRNKYFHDQKIESTQWCHPVLYYILELHNSGIDVDQWFQDREASGENGEPLHGGASASKEEIAYYYRKYLLLRENGYFSGMDTKHYLSARLSGHQIKSSLANTTQITFEVVDFCNLDCSYCRYGPLYNNYDRRAKKKMTPALAKTFLDYLLGFLDSPLNQSHGRPLHISFYGGEPLLNFPFIREIVDYIDQLEAVHNRFVFNMTTNGVLLEKHMDFLVEHDFELLISLDGNEYNTSYRFFHGGAPAYRRIMKNVTALKTKYPGYFKSRVNFNAVFHNRNSIDEIHRFFKTQFDKVPSISELSTSGINHSMRDRFMDTYANIGTGLDRVEDFSIIEKDMFARLPDVRDAGKFIDQCSGCVHSDYNDLLASVGSQDLRPRLPTGTCIPFSKKVFITVNGKILPCEQVGHQYSLGVVDENKVEMDFETLAETYNGYYDRLEKQCGVCADSKTCSQCSFFINIEKPDPKCSGMLSKKKFSKLLGSRMSYLENNPQVYMRIMEEVILE
ncbi:MAG: radical SAM peptide maturase [bacterium]|nr:radical SAM peptide maturase [bacterium]